MAIADPGNSPPPQVAYNISTKRLCFWFVISVLWILAAKGYL